MTEANQRGRRGMRSRVRVENAIASRGDGVAELESARADCRCAHWTRNEWATMKSRRHEGNRGAGATVDGEAVTSAVWSRRTAGAIYRTVTPRLGRRHELGSSAGGSGV